jgi:hypothetical protein
VDLRLASKSNSMLVLRGLLGKPGMFEIGLFPNFSWCRVACECSGDKVVLSLSRCKLIECYDDCGQADGSDDVESYIAR